MSHLLETSMWQFLSVYFMRHEPPVQWTIPVPPEVQQAQDTWAKASSYLPEASLEWNAFLLCSTQNMYADLEHLVSQLI